ncbi:MAG: hypothetical protein B9S34_05615 [Opitutia bacterium Tous-C1TDCM]|nr:MAG: hypothetical protein B9S34_05615 [Opitutae bacterium Tous-C1TDCM]
MVNSDPDPLPLSAGELDALFPFHLGIGPDGVLTRVGRSLRRLSDCAAAGQPLAAHFEPVRPAEPFDPARLRATAGRLTTIREKQRGTILRGQFQLVGGELLFVGSPWLTNVDDLRSVGLTMTDFAVQDPTLDLVQLLQLQNLAVEDLHRMNDRLVVQSNQLAEKEAQERKLSLVAARTDNAVVITDAERRIEWVNEAFTRITGYTLEEAVGRKPGAFLQGEETDPATVRMMREYLERGESFRVEVANHRRTGEPYWIELEVQPIREPGGRLTHFMAIEIDVTARRRAGENLRTQVGAAQVLAGQIEAGEALARVVDVIGREMNWAAALLWTAEGADVLRLAASRAEERPGAAGFCREMAELRLARGEDLPARVWAEAQLLPVSDLAEHADFRRGPAAIRAGLRSAVVLPVQENGRVVAVIELFSRWSGVPDEARLDALATVTSQLQQFLERVQARTALRQRTEELTRVNSRLGEAMRMKDSFLASMSHELRTPLTGILGLSETLIDQTYGPVNEKQLKYLRIVESSGRRLLSLINDLLDLAKIDSGQDKIEKSECLLDDVGDAAVRLVRFTSNQRRQEFDYRNEVRGLMVNLDRRRIGQALVNLLNNASKFTPEGGALGLRIFRRESELVFEIWDRGIGIAAPDQARLFQPFVQLDGRLARQYEGTGLGLALVKQIVTLHGGRVDVVSAPGAGSTFSIVLPLVGREDAAPAGIPGRAIRVLLAEDNPTNVIAIRDYLEQKGCEVTVAENGIAAVDQAVALAPDVILMDVQMPEMDGLEATRRIRALPDAALAATPIVAVTALTMDGDRELCLRAGANEYLAKPVSLKTLWSTVQALAAERPVPAAGSFAPFAPKGAAGQLSRTAPATS